MGNTVAITFSTAHYFQSDRLFAKYLENTYPIAFEKDRILGQHLENTEPPHFENDRLLEQSWKMWFGNDRLLANIRKILIPLR